MKYKVGDIVKLRDDLEGDKVYGGLWFAPKMKDMIGKPISIAEFDGKCYCVVDRNNKKWFISDEMIEGLWEECKSSEQVSKSEGKLRLIDILNKIANGELKEGTKVKHLNNIYIYKKYEGKEYASLYRETADSPEKDFFYDERLRFMSVILREEVELIEPNDFPDVGEMAECEHEWGNYTKHRIGEGIIRRFRRCKKCGLEENIEPACKHEWEKYTIGGIGTEAVELKHRRYCKICGIDEEEPTDNTKIEELDADYYEDQPKDYTIRAIINKLNEVIRKINKEDKYE